MQASSGLSSGTIRIAPTLNVAGKLDLAPAVIYGTVHRLVSATHPKTPLRVFHHQFRVHDDVVALLEGPPG